MGTDSPGRVGGPGLRHPWAWRALGAGYALLVLALSLLPARDLPEALPPDKISHLAAYAVLMLWFAQVPPASARRAMLALGVVLYGTLIEVLQPMLSDRAFELGDLAANALGVLIGWTLAHTPLGRIVPALDGGLAPHRR